MVPVTTNQSEPRALSLSPGHPSPGHRDHRVRDRVSGPTTRQVSTAGISSDFRIDMLQKKAGYSISMYIPIDGNKFKALNYPNEVVPHLWDHLSWTSSVQGQMIHTATMKWKAKAQFDVRFMPAWSCWCYLMWCFIWSFKNILEFPRVCWPTGTIVLEKPFLTGSEWVSSFQRKELYHLRMFQGGGDQSPNFCSNLLMCQFRSWRIHKFPHRRIGVHDSNLFCNTLQVEPLWKMMDFVSWDDYSIPNCFWKNPLKSIKPP
jgi:hypothetical protein